MVGCTVGQASRKKHRRFVRSSSRVQSGAFEKPASALTARRVRRPSWDYSDGLLAIAVIGGLSVSTIITLLFVPTALSLVRRRG
jgi:hypothetical protein